MKDQEHSKGNGQIVFSMQASRERADGWRGAAEECGARYEVVGTERRPVEIDGETIIPPHGHIVFQVTFENNDQEQQFFEESRRVRERTKLLKNVE